MVSVDLMSEFKKYDRGAGTVQLSDFIRVLTEGILRLRIAPKDLIFFAKSYIQNVPDQV